MVIEPLAAVPLDIEPFAVELPVIAPDALGFFFLAVILLSVIAPADMEVPEEPADIEPLVEAPVLEPLVIVLLDIAPEADCAIAEPTTATLKTAAAAKIANLDISCSQK